MAWYDKAVFYHIYPLGLLGAEKGNHGNETLHRLRELDKWVDHIKEMGFNAIYIGPLFESSSHGYDTKDYKVVDRRLGDNDDLKNFVRYCHDNGLKVILDGVFNHTGREFFAFEDLKANRENSPYKGWYLGVNFGGNNEYNDGFSYENWGGYNALVKLNQWNQEVKEYIYNVIRFWVSEFDIDGLRLDAADVLDFDYMKGMRQVANEVKPDFWLMGEVIHGEYNRWVNDDMLHSVTNYHLNKALWSGCNEHNFFEIAHTVKRLYDMGGGIYKRMQLYNFADNHDVDRIVNKLTNKDHLDIVYTLCYTLPGIPSVYYGSEFAIEGKKENGSDDPLRPAIDLKDHENAINDNHTSALIKKLGDFHMSSDALCHGEYKEILLTNRQYVFARYTDDEIVITAVNNDESPQSVTVYYDGKKTELNGLISGRKYSVSDHNITIELNGCGCDVIV